jgi:hypothetical protein
MVSDRVAKTQARKDGFGTKETRARDCGTVLFRSVLEGSDASHNSGIKRLMTSMRFGLLRICAAYCEWASASKTYLLRFRFLFRNFRARFSSLSGRQFFNWWIAVLFPSYFAVVFCCRFEKLQVPVCRVASASLSHGLQLRWRHRLEFQRNFQILF